MASHIAIIGHSAKRIYPMLGVYFNCSPRVALSGF